MLSKCIRAFKRWRIKRNVIEMTALFHNNSADLYVRAVVGLKLLTEPLDGYNENYCKFNLNGSCDLFINNIDILISRLEYHSNAYILTNINAIVLKIPEEISRNLDMEKTRWLDFYFNTLDVSVARNKLVTILNILQDKEGAYLSSSESCYVFKKDTKHILIELITLLKKYISTLPL